MASGPHPFTLESPATGAQLHGLVDLPELPGPRPTVVICHGFKGFMEWGFFPHLATLLAERGFAAIRFNFSGAGMLPGDETVTAPEAFRADTYSRELAEVEAILGATGDRIAAGRIDGGRLGLFGHSRGGGVAVLAAAREPWRQRLRALVTWASIAEADRFTPEQRAAWRRDGELPVINARTGQRLAMGTALLDDLESNAGSLDIPAAAARGRAPWLIVHGAEDESVPAFEASTLAERAGCPRSELHLVQGANHTFGSRHPWVGPTPHLIEALNATQSWFRRYLI